MESITVPAAGTTGVDVTIDYTIRNFGDQGVAVDLTDSIYLSTDDTFSGDDLLLGRVTHAGGIGAGETYAESLTAPLPGVIDGDYHVIVIADSKLAVADMDRENNTAAATDTVAISVPTIDFDMAVNGAVADGEVVLFRLDVSPLNDVRLQATLNAAHLASFVVGYERIPTPTVFDFVPAGTGEGLQTVVLPTPVGGAYYLALQGREGAGTGTPFQLLAERVSFGIDDVTPNRGSNAGTTTTTIVGSGFTSAAQVELDNGSVVTTGDVTFVDDRTLFVTFDLATTPSGTYDVVLVDQSGTTTAAGAFVVNSGPVGQLDFALDTAEFIRAGRPGTVTVEYVNIGETDVTAPLIVVEAINAKFRRPGAPSTEFVQSRPTENEFDLPSVGFLGINREGPAGVLPPGARGTFTLDYLPDTFGQHVISEFVLFVSPEDSDAPNRWQDFKDDFQPPWVPDDAWDAIFDNISQQVGTTVGQLEQTLADNATHLSRVGETVSDTDVLMAYELQEAGVSTIAQRYFLGAFGRGRPGFWEQTARARSDGSVVLSRGAQQRFFFLEDDGSYRGAAGDFATLTRDAGDFQIQETGGGIIAFHPDGRLNFEQDPDGIRFTYNYTGGRVTSIDISTGETLQIQYDANGRVSASVDVLGRTTTYTYDAAGEHLMQVDGPETTTSFMYVVGQGAAREHAIASIDVGQDSPLFFEYDDLGRISRVFRTNNADELLYTYDGGGSVTVTDAAGGSGTVLLNSAGLPAAMIDSQGRAMQLSYTADHRISDVRLPQGARFQYENDDRGNPVAVTNPLGERIEVEYHPTFQAAASFSDPNGNLTSFEYDADGNLSEIVYADGSNESIVYDSIGNATQWLNGRGQQVDSTYNSFSGLTRQDLPDGTHLEYVYDTNRNLVTASHVDGGNTITTTFAYDALERLSRVTYPSGRFLDFTYDAGGLRTSMTDQDGRSVQYVYDSSGRLERLLDENDQLIAEYIYDAVGRLERKDFANGTFTTFGFDERGLLVDLENHAPDSSILSEFEYAYDAYGRTTSIATLDGVSNYEYDALGRMTRAEFPGGRVILYEYDAFGNRVSVTDNAVVTAYSTNGLNQYTSADGTTYQYDADGNLIEKTDSSGTTTYAYDALGQVTSITSPTDVWTYEYDALGFRIAATHNGQRSEYVVDPFNFFDFVGEYDQGGSLIASYVYGADGLVSQRDGSSATSFYAFDAIGNTSVLTDSAGDVANSYSYLPFGEKLTSVETVHNPFTYSGRYGVFDGGEGLYFADNRWLDPETGRWTQRDPVRFATDDFHLYQYVGNSPLDAIDPLGLSELSLPSEGTIKFMMFDEAVRQGNLTNLPEIVSPGSRTGSKLLLPVGLAASSFWHPAVDSAFTQGVKGLTYHGTELLVTEGLANNLGTGASVTRTPFAQHAGQLATEWSGTTAGRFATWAPRVARVGGPAVVFTTGMDIATFAARNPRCPHPEEVFPKLNSEDGPDYYRTVIIEWTRQPTEQLASGDPNDITGPGGFGSEHFVQPDRTMPYTIRFENVPTATAPAAEVFITHQLDVNLGLDTFELGDIGFGDTVIDVPDGRDSFEIRVDLTATKGVFVDVEAGVDRTTRTVRWTFTAIDPTTGDVPIDPSFGFLPPNVTEPEGEGFVRFSVRSNSGLPTGTIIDAQATIIFDLNEPIDTPIYTNTIDNDPPTSSVDALPAVTNAETFTVTWIGDDGAGSGVAFFDVFVSADGGPFELFQEATTDTSADFTGQFGSTYEFYSVAVDNIGFREAVPATPDAMTLLQQAVNDPPTANVTGPATGAPGASLEFIVSATDPNPGDEAAGFTYVIDWMDGSPLQTIPATPNNGAGVAVTHVFDTAGAFTIEVTATDQGGETSDPATHQLQVVSGPPTANVTGSAAGVPGQALEFIVSATDTNTDDEAAGFTYVIDWNDGSPLQTIPATLGNGAGVLVTHVFETTGSFAVEVTATDQGDETSELATHVVEVSSTALVPDPDNPGRSILLVGGTDRNDTMLFFSFFQPDKVRLKFNRDWLGPFSDVSRIEAYGQDGDDKLAVLGWIEIPVMFDGGNGNDWLIGGRGPDVLLGRQGHDLILGGRGDDLLEGNSGRDVRNGNSGDDTLKGGTGNDKLFGGSGDDVLKGWKGNDKLHGQSGNDILLGGDGQDYLFGSRGRDILIGGAGRDWLSGGSDQDILIGGLTTHDLPALESIREEWTSGRGFATRQANITDGSGSVDRLNGDNFLQLGVTVLDDDENDFAFGGLGKDWFVDV